MICCANFVSPCLGLKLKPCHQPPPQLFPELAATLLRTLFDLTNNAGFFLYKLLRLDEHSSTSSVLTKWKCL